MKKHILLLTAIFLIVQLAIAQKPDAAVAIVRYSFSHLCDTTNKTNFYTENMELLLGKNASIYRSADKRLQDEQMKKQIADQVSAGATSNITLNAVGKSRASNITYYQFQAEKKLIRQEKQFNNYLVEESWPLINWKITADTASFGSLHCQKATTAFKGRNYEAWFCPALPFHSGPWKLNGLPGLIVEASDSKKEVAWKFAGLEDVSQIVASASSTNLQQQNNATPAKGIMVLGLEENISSNTIMLPQNGIKTTEKELAQLKETMQKNPTAFLQSALAGSGSTFKLINTMPAAKTTPVKNQINNPIELSEKP